jgi:hypothetical protein
MVNPRNQQFDRLALTRAMIRIHPLVRPDALCDESTQSVIVAQPIGTGARRRPEPSD